MAFTVSEGKLQAIHKPVYTAPTSVRLTDDLSEDYAEIYRKQSEVRVAVDFLARNVAQLGLHVFRRENETDRQRLREHPLALLLASPNPYTTAYRLIHGLISDRGIYDRALWAKVLQNGVPQLVRIPPRLWTIDKDDNWLNPSAFVVKGSRGKAKIPAGNAVYFRGYNPLDERYGLSPIESLRRALSEEYAAGQMREQTLRNGARFSGYLSRPKDAPKWSLQARDRFRTGWRQQYLGWSATDAGGTPVLEDGMTFTAASQSAVDLQYVEARKLTREEVAAAYFIPPPMIGMLDKATFSNITEQHKMLYQDTLGPILMEIKQELELQILPDFDDREGVYVEFNLQEKLRGSFEEQAQQLQTSVGAPYLTRNEARARANLPHIEGGDELVVPLNVLVGYQASPTDSGSQNLRAQAVRQKGASITVKAPSNPNYATQIESLLGRFFERQRRVVLSELGAKSASWWDEERWDRELAEDLLKLSLAITVDAAKSVLEYAGLDADRYDSDRTVNFLTAVAKSRAHMVNQTTSSQIAAILAGRGPADADSPAHVFDVALAGRGAIIAETLATTYANFATSEAGKQSGGSTKTWLTTSGNPRPEHAAMHGETVPIDAPFSNGASWPGDPVLGADGVAGCSCEVEVTFG